MNGVFTQPMAHFWQRHELTHYPCPLSSSSNFCRAGPGAATLLCVVLYRQGTAVNAVTTTKQQGSKRSHSNKKNLRQVSVCPLFIDVITFRFVFENT
jgi:hypothetical protein